MDAEIKAYILEHVASQEVEHIRELLKIKDEQIKHQAIEYERRLSELNHAHDQAQEAFKTYVSLNVYNPAQDEIKKRLELMQSDMNIVSNKTTRNQEELSKLANTLTWVTRTIVGVILVAAVSFVLRGLPMGSGPSLVP